MRVERGETRRRERDECDSIFSFSYQIKNIQPYVDSNKISEFVLALEGDLVRLKVPKRRWPDILLMKGANVIMPPQGEVDATVELDAHICSSESVPLGDRLLEVLLRCASEQEKVRSEELVSDDEVSESSSNTVSVVIRESSSPESVVVDSNSVSCQSKGANVIMPPQGEVDITVELDAHICSSESVVSTEVDSDSESSISLCGREAASVCAPELVEKPVEVTVSPEQQSCVSKAVNVVELRSSEKKKSVVSDEESVVRTRKQQVREECCVDSSVYDEDLLEGLGSLGEAESSEKENFRKETREDKTLQHVRVLATENKMGYSWEDGLIFQTNEDSVEGVRKRLVIPKGRRDRSVWPMTELAT